jgi:hypothetical protein
MSVDGRLQPHLRFDHKYNEKDNYGILISVDNPSSLFMKIKYIFRTTEIDLIYQPPNAHVHWMAAVKKIRS